MTTPIHVLQDELNALLDRQLADACADACYGMNGELRKMQRRIKAKRAELDKARERLERECHYTKDVAE